MNWLLAETMRVDDILLLYQRQSGLRNLCVTKTDQPFFPSLKTRPGVLSSLKSVESAEIYASDEDALRAGQIILETYHDLKNLSVHIDSECTDSSFSFTKQNPQAAKKRTEPIMSLFSHMLPFGSCSAMNLRSLKLIDLNLQQAAATLLKVINFSRLEDLTFHSCTGMQQFLQAMTKAFAATTTESNRLSSLSMELYEEEERPLMDDLDRFLLVLAKRVTWLSLCIMDARRCPNVEGIVRQASSLSTLLVVILDEVGQQIAYSAQEFSRISSNCVKLEQLSLSFPPDSDQSLWNFMASAWQLPSLHTLNIASWPSLSVGLGLEDYKAQLQLFAQRIFESNDRYTSKLAALGIGTDCYAGLNEGDTVQGHIERADYVRGKRAGIFGQNIVLAIPITVCLLQYTHPDSNLLHDDPLDLWTGLHPAIN
ncbi:MAG: hypothetical protein M1812_005027 [Candelaria pacifica]|nr:MAG: hypothetical protein M1812_005027 [Candelaria pacifica]